MYIPDYPYSLQLQGRLLSLETPVVMGIVNVTPDSFYKGSRCMSVQQIIDNVGMMLDDGASIIDMGGCSTRPSSMPASLEEERDRVLPVLRELHNAFPEALLSIDTFRASIAREAVERCGVAMINDVSGGVDEDMFNTVAGLQVSYVLTDNTASGEKTDYISVTQRMALSILKLRKLGVNDVVADPGMGFGKTAEACYALLAHLHDILIALQVPIMIGVSRKSMIYNVLDTVPEKALNGTTALNIVALCNGAHILRVHDVKEAVECVKLYEAYREGEKSN